MRTRSGPLGRAGASPSEIGRFVEIRYQHAYNVLKRFGISRAGNTIRDTESRAESASARASSTNRGGYFSLSESERHGARFPGKSCSCVLKETSYE